MNAKTISQTPASDEITDAQLNNISGGVTDFDDNMVLARRPRPSGGGSNPTPQPPTVPKLPNGTMNQPPRR